MDKKTIESFKTKVALRKKIYHGDYGIKRWFDNGEIITLSVKQETYRNVEFIVNGDNHRIIWFSQFSPIYFCLDNGSLVVSDITLKDGTSRIIREMTPTEFIEVVKGKKFKVVCNSGGPVARFREENAPCNTYFEYAKIIMDLINKGELDRAADYLSPTTEYSLEEV